MGRGPTVFIPGLFQYPTIRDANNGAFPQQKTEDVCALVRGVYSGVDIDLQEQEGGGRLLFVMGMRRSIASVDFK